MIRTKETALYLAGEKAAASLERLFGKGAWTINV
jgi:hypothetical protein